MIPTNSPNNPGDMYRVDVAVVIPVQQALIVATSAFILVFVIAVSFGASPIGALKGSAVIGIVMGVVYLFWQLWRWNGKTALYWIEQASGKDIDGDGEIGQPAEQEAVTVNHFHHDASGTVTGGGWSKENPDLMRRVAEACLGRNLAFSVGALCRCKPSIITQDEYKYCKENWTKEDPGIGRKAYLRYRDPRYPDEKGLELTEYGREVLYAFLSPTRGEPVN